MSRRGNTRTAALTLLAEDDVDGYAAGRRADALVRALESAVGHNCRWRLVRDEFGLTPLQATKWLQHCGYVGARK